MNNSHGYSFAIPLVVAVTGHRDLLASELPGLRQRVQDFLSGLAERFPDRRLTVMSSLAEGADQLVAEVALELGIDLQVPLPMPKDLYLQDFETIEARARFESLCERALEVFELPLAKGNTVEKISQPGPARSREYAQVGVFLCAHCHILLALWDGKPGTELGGTGQVVKFHHDDIMPGYTTRSVATQQMLVDDESDLVYHIVCSRDRPDGAPREGLKPLDWCWFTQDRENPRNLEIPDQHKLIFARSDEFSRDAMQHAKEIDAEKYPLYSEEQVARLPRGVDDINRLFCTADWLAIHFQKKIMLTLRVTHLLAFLMGLMFILYMDLQTWSYFMFAFLLFFVVSAAVQSTARRRGWHRKYLDYRTLAEGLRVQFYWAVAGVGNDNESKFTHDNFLQTQDPELGWIRNVMRVAGTECDVARSKTAAGLDFVMHEWIGDENSGQLGYFGKKARERIRKNRFTERLGQLSLLSSVAVVLLFVTVGSRMPDAWTPPLMVFMGTMLLLFGIRQGYAYATAEKELIKQYEFMFRLFQNARRRLDNSDDPAEQRLILRALGGSALDEHAEWILMHRDRTVDKGEIWRMSN
ncbi:MAG: DUF4231 domain-containing protein [Gammaproteobacteria bacterium]|nr:DUF4231 domain-containing protein [Gammaproteobacteria bacterium]MDH4315502.1 DUF4231 domain-containing protein [Gammaproteobacteria bacterium]MDH5214638.1 DUF4231 domain-containing protein [Gammaproteobacteria bacterium]MDH5502095.1 DUF4231 domain-containing protein [Gammaproteobacteria bacterium]